MELDFYVTARLDVDLLDDVAHAFPLELFNVEFGLVDILARLVLFCGELKELQWIERGDRRQSSQNLFGRHNAGFLEFLEQVPFDARIIEQGLADSVRLRVPRHLGGLDGIVLGVVQVVVDEQNLTVVQRHSVTTTGLN